MYHNLKAVLLSIVIGCCLQRAAAAPPATVVVGDFVWFDIDRDGLQDAGEPGFVGMQILLLDGNGNTVATTVSDVNGYYSFTGVETGADGRYYEVQFRIPAAYRFTKSLGANGDINNSDANELTGKTGLVLMRAGADQLTLDAGVVTVGAGSLALHTLDLTTRLNGQRAMLQWVAENEMNTAQFFIQQSSDGNNFTDLALVPVNGPVNSPTTYTYQADLSSLTGQALVYFRIRAEDDVKRSAYSNITPLRLEQTTGIRAWPNPFADRIQVNYTASANTTIRAELSDNAGLVVLQTTFTVNRGINQLPLAVGPIPAGIYRLVITDQQSGQRFCQVLLK